MATWSRSKMLYLLMLITMMGFLVSGAATTLQNVPLIVNKLKTYSISWLLFSITSLPLTWILIKFTPLDIYAVAIVPTALEVLANVTFVPIYASTILKVSNWTFYPVYLQYVASTVLSLTVCIGIKHLLHISSKTWVAFFISAVIYTAIASIITLLTLLGNRERNDLWDIIKRKLHLKVA